MARKNTTAVEEVDETLPTTPEENYSDIKDKSFADVAAPTEKVEKGDDSDGRVRDEHGRFVPQKEEVKEEKPEVDVEKIKQEVREEVKKEVTQEQADKIVQAITGKDQATVQEKDKYQQIAEEFEQKNGRPPSWHELIPYLVEDAKASIKADQDAQVKEQQAQQDTVKAQQEEYTKQFNAKIDADLNDLYTSARLPKIQEKDNPTDFGVVARKALFQTMMDVNTKRVQAGEQPITSIKEIFYEHYKMPSTQGPAGYDAPVNMGRGGSMNAPDEEVPYHQLHNKTFDQLARGQ